VNNEALENWYGLCSCWNQ